jgi:hypothetical protein
MTAGREQVADASHRFPLDPSSLAHQFTRNGAAGGLLRDGRQDVLSEAL